MPLNDPARDCVTLGTGWRFCKMDFANGMHPDLDDSQWEEVAVPHDWAIGGAFDHNNDVQRTQILEDGETKVDEHIGRTGGLPHVGTAWYRYRFIAPETWVNRRVYIEFDGAMSHSSVYVNGNKVGVRPYGYVSFMFDLTEHLIIGKENLLAVRLDNKPFSSRWYPGAGIYREVRLVAVDPVHVPTWGTFITTPTVSTEQAAVKIRTTVANQNRQNQMVDLVIDILSPEGERVSEVRKRQLVHRGDSLVFDMDASVPHPQLWDIETPQLYTSVTQVMINGHTVDTYRTRFGIRSIEFNAEKGFLLNGRRVKFKGVCLHHDLGALGAAVNYRAIERRLELLRDMGCNAIRCCHNPPATELLDLCDTMGFLVINEAFDEWRMGKVANGYHLLFDTWAERDLRDLIRRDRNHPSVVMWSIGNEIRDQEHKEGAAVAQFLTDICHQEDPTRPVTAGFDRPQAAIENGLAAVVDVVGWNYEHPRYQDHLNAHPDWIMYGAETASTVSSRGEYYMPPRDARNIVWPSLHCSAYEVEAPPWGCPAEYEFAQQEQHPALLGQFTWTGFDYLGEPTPYKTQWPSRSSYFGIFDLAGFPKDRYYLYRSLWTDDPVLHVFPHWTWPGHEGRIIPIHCYTNFDAAELFLNGRSLGIQRKAAADSRTTQQQPETLGWPFTRFRLMWDVPYEPGVLEVVALNTKGDPVLSQRIVTAGPPARIQLVPDRTTITADGNDLSFVTVRIEDAQGHLCPTASNRIVFDVIGPGTVAGVDNGDPTCLEPFMGNTYPGFNGLCLVMVRSRADHKGEIRIEARAQGLETAVATVKACLEEPS